jgi:small-conductance mechanosensitive channel
MGSDLPEVIRIFSEAVKAVDHVLADPPVDVLPWELRDNNVHVHVRWWTRSQRSYEVRTRAAVVAAIHRAAAEHGIDIPPDDTISFADTPLYMVETKAPKKPRKQVKPPASVSPERDASEIDPRCLDEPQDPEAEKPKSGELNKGLADVPR